MANNEEYFVKHNVSKHEYDMHKHVYSLNIVNVPEIISYDIEKQILTMKNIKNMNVSDMYGENAKDVDEDVMDKIRTIIKTLTENNIEYQDITGYNFIEYEDKIWIIDFEHSKISNKIEDKYIIKFINGLNKWNPNFR